MTQSITNCNVIPEGKTYPVEDLRTAESIEQLCEYVDTGHPIATNYGGKAMYFRRRGACFHYDFCVIDGGDWDENYEYETDVLDRVKLAPLAYRNGRPLHVGDEVKVGNDTYEICSPWFYESIFNTYGKAWRFADEVKT